MKVINEVHPKDPSIFQDALKDAPEGPVFMINLLTFKEKAVYEDGRETDLTGRQAYNLYGLAVMQLLPEYGAQIFFSGDTTFLPLGQVEELWDEVAIAVYPNRKALVDMSMSAEWQAAAVHRTAGLKGQLNIETVLSPALKGLPWIQSLYEAMNT